MKKAHHLQVIGRTKIKKKNNLKKQNHDTSKI
jgi:hypothetical protein